MSYQADLRYTGQAFQITVNFSEEELKEKGLALITDQFDAEHEQLFSFKLEDGHEILMIRAVAKAKSQDLDVLAAGDPSFTLADCKICDTRFYYAGEWHDAQIYDRSKLHQSLVVDGPAIVSEMDSTTVILPGHQANVDVVGNLLITPAK